jgi:hypothetical protein
MTALTLAAAACPHATDVRGFHDRFKPVAWSAMAPRVSASSPRSWVATK